LGREYQLGFRFFCDTDDGKCQEYGQQHFIYGHDVSLYLIVASKYNLN
jgi:hypothetical protein